MRFRSFIRAAGRVTVAALFLISPAAAQEGGGIAALTGGESASGGSSAGGGESSGGGASSEGSKALDMQSAAYVHRPTLNAGLPTLDDPPDLETPQSSLASFVDACEAGDYDRASRSMDLNAFEADRQATLGPTLARQLKSILEQKLWIDWDEVPDRPDGQGFGPSLKAKASGTSTDGPKSFHELGVLGKVHGRPITAYMERVKTPEAAPVWVISKRTVSAIPELYEQYGPGPFGRAMPPALKSRVLGIALWEWIGIVLFLLIGLAIGWLVQEGLERILKGKRSNWALALAWAVHGPVAAIVALTVFQILATGLLRLAGPVMSMAEPIIFILIVLACVWLLSRVIDFASRRLTDRYQGDDKAAEAHSVITRVKVGKHFLTVVVLTAGIAVALWQFEWFRAIGYGLLASAGIAALVLGLAAQRPLGNLFAGVQLAITQPVRVGDAVIFEGEWGWIEEIAVTYVVIRTWDMRRLIVPTAHLMDNPIENWTKGGENMMKPVYLSADYRVDVGAVRTELERILKDSNDWDEEVPPTVQVTACKDETVELRALCSAKTPPDAWNLHCVVRERLVAFLRDLEGGAYLPRTRVAMVPGSASDDVPSGDDSKSERRKSRRGKARSRSGRDADKNRAGSSKDGDKGDGG